MKNELTTYLRHDSNSRNDEKILRLHRKYPNGSGYGIFWMIIECLAESSEGRLPLSSIDDIAFGMHSECERITDIIQNFNLFKTDGMYFWSERLCEHLEEVAEKTKKAKRSAAIRWHSKATNKTMRTHSERNANAMLVKKSKEENSKEINTPLFDKSVDVFSNMGEQASSPERAEQADPTPLPPAPKAPSYKEGAEAYGESEVIFLLPAEYRKLCQKFGNRAVNRKIKAMDSWKMVSKKNLKMYSSDYHAITNWFNRDDKYKPDWNDFRESDFDSKEDYDKRMNSLNQN